jgi:hypothetical protein
MLHGQNTYSVLDILPYDSGHLVAVQFDDGVLDLDLAKARHVSLQAYEARPDGKV